MTPEQALQLLNQATGEAKLTRQDHVAVQEAITILGKLINEYNDLKKEKGNIEKEETKGK